MSYTLLTMTLYNYEKEISEFWENENINSQVSKLGDKPFNFIDGPPFVSGSLHTGSLSVGFYKDIVLRYKRMHGFNCTNKIGFDCHGLPSENMVMKILNLNSKKDIEDYGVDLFINKCIETIHKYSLSWKPSYDKIARIVDFNNQYKTIDTPFMETLWWIFKQIYDKGLMYKAFKVMPYSWVCETPLSNFEAGLNYKNVSTETVYVKFKSKNFDNMYFVAWTTTLWTLPSNVALCVNPNLMYVKCLCEDGSILIVSENTVNNLKIKFISVENFKLGKDMEGLEYEPLFNFMKFKFHKILIDNYVQDSKDIGTSIVHISPSHGEDDCRICLDNNVIAQDSLDQTCIVDDQGKFIIGTGFLEGIQIFESNKQIMKYLNEQQLNVRTQTYTHSYPHCYRSETKLIYKITSSYFIAVSKIKDKLVEMNEKISWSNPDIGEKKFKNWLENAKDWCISRNRYFGTPIPVWESDDCSESVVIGSIDELVKKANLDSPPKDLHLNNIKDIVIISDSGKVLKPCLFTLDCWFESGSAPYGQIHYPFENKNAFDNKDYLCDFIVEGLDQTRGWFYTLLIISTIISNKPAYTNVICTGLVLGDDGKKESKKNGNFVPPIERIEQFGADSIRLYLASSPLINGEPVKFSNDKVKEMNNVLIQYLNTLNFYSEQQQLNKIANKNIKINYITHNDNLSNPTDLWILKKLSKLQNKVEEYVNLYQLDKATNNIIDFIENMSNWYLKLNRDRLKGKITEDEQSISLSVLFTILFDYTLIIAPFAPFISEKVYGQLTKDLDHTNQLDKYLQLNKSIHMCIYPNIDRNWIDEKSFDDLKEIVLAVRQIRGKNKSHISQRVPIKKCLIYHYQQSYLDNVKNLISYVSDEINSLEFEYCLMTHGMKKRKVKINHKILGQTFKKNSIKLAEQIENLSQHELENFEKNKEIMIGDFLINEQMINIEISLKTDENDNDVIYSHNELILQLDLTLDKQVNDTNHVKKIIALIQQFRKEIGLKPWDKIKVKIENNDVFTNQYNDMFSNKLGCLIETYNEELTLYNKDYTYFDINNYEINMKIYIYILQ
jgi:isoleucyl-tRNA synthetase